MNVCLKDFGVVCALGLTKQEVVEKLQKTDGEILTLDENLPFDSPQYVGRVNIPERDDIQSIKNRNNQLAFLAYEQIAPTLKPLIKHYGKQRIAVVIGTSTAGILEGEKARKVLEEKGEYPETYHYEMQEMVAPARYIAELCQAQGPVYTVSTACSSSGKSINSARAILAADLADVVIAGGVDSLSQLTTNGFNSLDSIAQSLCSPFDKSRDGINIGEAAALFVITKENKGIQVLGVGETSDAYHLSAPDPQGEGAYQAMIQALAEANIKGKDVSYVNLHGTATPKNDQMEALAMNRACGENILCGSTKRFTGHCLGAAGALEIGFCWLLLHDEYNPNNDIPANFSGNNIDDDLAKIKLSAGQNLKNITYCMSNSFAFGGNNFSVVLGKQ